MKNLLTIFTLLFTVVIPSTSFAEWTKIADDNVGDSWYVNFERIRKHDGYVYYWRLADQLKPDNLGYLSTAVYYQGDCSLFRTRVLSFSYYKEPMGGGTGESWEPTGKNANWNYAAPNSIREIILEEVCNAVGK